MGVKVIPLLAGAEQSEHLEVRIRAKIAAERIRRHERLRVLKIIIKEAGLDIIKSTELRVDSKPGTKIRWVQTMGPKGVFSDAQGKCTRFYFPRPDEYCFKVVVTNGKVKTEEYRSVIMSKSGLSCFRRH